MDPTKKRKLDENGVASATSPSSSPTKLTPEDARKLMQRFTTDQLLDILQTAVVRHPDVLSSVRSVADSDPSQRKLFIRGLGWDTTSDTLRSLFAAYGDLEEAVVITDKTTGKSKGYGFVIFKHVEGALLALREPSKKIDGRVTVTQLAAAGNTGGSSSASVGSGDVSGRKIYVANVPQEMGGDKLLAHFSQYGEIEEGPLGFDKLTGKSRGFALFVYKTVEGAQASLVEPTKVIEGRHLNCKLAIDGKKGKSGGGGASGGGPPGSGVQSGNVNDGMGMGGFGGPSGMGGPPPPYGGGYSGAPPQGLGMNSSMGGGGQGMGSQGPGSFSGGSGGGMGAPYSGYGGPGSTGYAGPSSTGYGGPSSTGYGGYGAGGGASGGGGSSMYRLPPSSAGMSAGGYPETGHYGGLSSSSTAFQGQHQGTPPAPRIPHGGTYPNLPPYY